MKLDFYYPFGILDCKNLKEKICLHLIEHIFVNNLIKSLDLNLENISAGIAFDHIGINLNIEFKKVKSATEFFRNFNINKIRSKDFELQKNRVIEEEELLSLDLVRNTRSCIMNMILNNNSAGYNKEEVIEIIKKTRFEEIRNFYENIYDFEKSLIISLGKDVKLIKQSSLKTLENVEIKSLPKKIIRKGPIPKSFLYLIYIEPSLSDIFLTRILTQKLEDFIKEEIILEKGLAYSYFFKPLYPLFSKLFYFFLVPSTQPNKIMKKFLFFKKSINLSDKYVQEEKEKFLNKKINEILKISRPAIIWSALKNNKVLNSKDLINTIKNVNSNHILSLNFKEIYTIII